MKVSLPARPVRELYYKQEACDNMTEAMANKKHGPRLGFVRKNAGILFAVVLGCLLVLPFLIIRGRDSSLNCPASNVPNVKGLSQAASVFVEAVESADEESLRKQIPPGYVNGGSDITRILRNHGHTASAIGDMVRDEQMAPDVAQVTVLAPGFSNTEPWIQTFIWRCGGWYPLLGSLGSDEKTPRPLP